MGCTSSSCSRSAVYAPTHVQSLPAWARRGKTGFCCDECAADSLNAAGDAPVITRNPNAGNKGAGGAGGGSEYGLDGASVVAGLGSVGGSVGGIYGQAQETERARIAAAAATEQARIIAAGQIEAARIAAARGGGGGGGGGVQTGGYTILDGQQTVTSGSPVGGVAPRTDSGMNLDVNTWSTEKKVGAAVALSALGYWAYTRMNKRGRR